MVGMARIFIGGLPISKELSKNELLKVVSAYSKDVEIIRDAEGYCKGFAYINVPSASAETCISKLNGTSFNKGLLRVEHAQESYMDRLRREWGDEALNKQYKFPSTPSTPSTPHTPLDTTAKAGNSKIKSTPNGKSEPKPTANSKVTKLEESTEPSKPLSKNAQKKEEYKARVRAKQAEKKAAKLGNGVAEDGDSSNNNKRKAEEIESEEEEEGEEGEDEDEEDTPPVPAELAPVEPPKPSPKKAPAKPAPKLAPAKPSAKSPAKPAPKSAAKPPAKPTPKIAANGKKKVQTLDLGDDEEPLSSSNTITHSSEAEEEHEPEPEPEPEVKPTPKSKSTPKPTTTPTPTPKPTPKSAAKKQKQEPTNTTPAKQVPTTPVPPTPTPASPPVNGEGVSFWDMAQVQTWAAGVAGDEIAEKLKSKGVKGRKLINWKDSFTGNPNGLRKQITDFLQLPEHMEADADDFSVAVLKLQ